MPDSNNTLDDILRETDSLLGRARTLRLEADRFAEQLAAKKDAAGADITEATPQSVYEKAEAPLLEAVSLLQPALSARDALWVGSESTEASEDRKKLADKLADIYGQLGGLARRAGDLAHALDFYTKGRMLEENPAYRIRTTYNRVQAIVLQLLVDPSTIEDIKLLEQARSVRRMPGLDNGPWGNADTVLLSAILGDRQMMREAWQVLVDSRPSQKVFSSGILVLSSLVERLPENALLNRARALYQQHTAS
jgi:tetratricopeptide (TPR) repeat protein